MNVHPQIARTLPNGNAMVGDKPATKHIPYTRFLPGGFLATRNGDVMAVFSLRGISHETVSLDTLSAAERSISELITQLDDGRYVIYTHTIRHKVDALAELSVIESNDFAGKLDAHYRHQISGTDSYEIKHYITIVRTPPKLPGVGFLASIKNLVSGNADKKSTKEIRAKEIEALKVACRLVSEMLSEFDVRQLTDEVEDRKKALQFLTMLASGCWLPAPDKKAGLAHAISVGRLIFRDETVSAHGPSPDLNRYAAVLAISSYPDQTDNGMFDDLLGEPIEFILTQSFTPLDRVTGGRKIDDARVKMNDAGDEAESLIADLAQARDDIASRRKAIGRHHFSLTVFGESRKLLDEALPQAVSAMASSGFRIKREDIGMELAWWAQLPGNMNYEVRSGGRLISNQNVAEMASFHSYPKGATKGLRWGGPVTMLKTGAGTPYYFGFHRPGSNEPGTTAVFGATGAGKTAVVNFLLAQTRRLRPAPDIIFFDKDRGAESFIKAMGGDYMRLRPGENLGFNPFQTAVDEAGINWLAQFIHRLIGFDKNLSPEQLRRIADAAKRNGQAADASLRNFADFADVLRSTDDAALEIQIVDALQDWHSGGDKAWLFANEDDSFSMDRHTMGFDMTALLETPVIRSAIMDYLFYRIEQKLQRGYPTIIVLDEAWRLLDDPRFQNRIKDWIKTIRKQNGIVIFMTQEPADAVKSPISETLIQSTDNKIFFPAPSADEASYMDAFKLSRPEFELVRAMRKEQRAVLVKNWSESVTVSVRLSDAEKFLKVLSGTSESVVEMDMLREEHGENWLDVFMNGSNGMEMKT